MFPGVVEVQSLRVFVLFLVVEGNSHSTKGSTASNGVWHLFCAYICGSQTSVYMRTLGECFVFNADFDSKGLDTSPGLRILTR